MPPEVCLLVHLRSCPRTPLGTPTGQLDYDGHERVTFPPDCKVALGPTESQQISSPSVRMFFKPVDGAIKLFRASGVASPGHKGSTWRMSGPVGEGRPLKEPVTLLLAAFSLFFFFKPHRLASIH